MTRKLLPELYNKVLSLTQDAARDQCKLCKKVNRHKDNCPVPVIEQTVRQLTFDNLGLEKEVERLKTALAEEAIVNDALGQVCEEHERDRNEGHLQEISDFGQYQEWMEERNRLINVIVALENVNALYASLFESPECPVCREIDCECE